ncbi:MAG TPA: replication-associated recombination protein A, partial [Candidatus Saccharimonadales bacterium]|nr:replication-associated recombination protein A [Candidatus Saccharimonadales bacterium]
LAAMSLFSNPINEASDPTRPLADRMRPRDLDEFVGQEHILGTGKALRVQIDRDDIGSILFWGPPGVGKTTLAKIIARRTKAEFVEFSAVMAGIKEIKQVMVEGERARQYGTRTIVFIDEIHRFNRAQQDAFLPHVERGNIRLIGATTENPSFEVNSALLSRSRVYTLNPLTEEQIVALLERALVDEQRGLGVLKLTAKPEALARIAAYSSGDARSGYNVLEIAATLAVEAAGGASGGVIEQTQVEDALQRRVLRYDKAGEEHYNLISALHKSVRNSDPDATLYWLVRMLESGEDPMYLARRIVRMAVEDISLADPHALEICIAARDALDFMGLPEGGLALAHAAVYLAIAPKSNALYKAYGMVKRDVEETAADPVPLHLRNAPTRLMKELGYGEGYKYAHDFEDKVADMECLPDNLKGKQWYFPTDEGVEKRIRERLASLRVKKQKIRE